MQTCEFVHLGVDVLDLGVVRDEPAALEAAFRSAARDAAKLATKGLFDVLIVGAGASGALNMWYDADIDALMSRTKTRPVPSGRVTAGEVMSTSGTAWPTVTLSRKTSVSRASSPEQAGTPMRVPADMAIVWGKPTRAHVNPSGER